MHRAHKSSQFASATCTRLQRAHQAPRHAPGHVCGAESQSPPLAHPNPLPNFRGHSRHKGRLKGLCTVHKAFCRSETCCMHASASARLNRHTATRSQPKNLCCDRLVGTRLAVGAQRPASMKVSLCIRLWQVLCKHMQALGKVTVSQSQTCSQCVLPPLAWHLCPTNHNHTLTCMPDQRQHLKPHFLILTPHDFKQPRQRMKSAQNRDRESQSRHMHATVPCCALRSPTIRHALRPALWCTASTTQYHCTTTQLLPIPALLYHPKPAPATHVLYSLSTLVAVHSA